MPAVGSCGRVGTAPVSSVMPKVSLPGRLALGETPTTNLLRAVSTHGCSACTIFFNLTCRCLVPARGSVVIGFQLMRRREFMLMNALKIFLWRRNLRPLQFRFPLRSDQLRHETCRNRSEHPARVRDGWWLFAGRASRPHRLHRRECQRCHPAGRARWRRGFASASTSTEIGGAELGCCSSQQPAPRSYTPVCYPRTFAG